MCQHFSIARLVVSREVGAHTRQRILGHGIALFHELQQQLWVLRACSLNIIGSLSIVWTTLQISHTFGKQKHSFFKVVFNVYISKFQYFSMSYTG